MPEIKEPDKKIVYNFLGTLVYTMETTQNVLIGETASGMCDQKVFCCSDYTFRRFEF